MSDTPMFPNWFDGQKHNFENHLTKFKGKPNLKFLQVGAYTGDASEWLLSNILLDQSSTLTDVDTWEGSDEREHKAMDFNLVYGVYRNRMSKYENVIPIKGDSALVLSILADDYDFIYIDGDHTEEAVYRDAMNAWPRLKTGGVLAFDDYLWGQDVHPSLRPQIAIDKFLEMYNDSLIVLHKGYQVWVQKK